MLKELCLTINWTDGIVLLILLRCIVMGAARGFAVELFKLLGMIFAAFLTLHYYVRVAAMLGAVIPFGKGLLQFLSFVLLWFLVVIVFVLIRMGWMLILNTDKQSLVGKWFAALMGALRGVLVSGLLFILVTVPGWQWPRRAIAHGLTGPRIERGIVRMYRAVYEGVSRVFPDEEPNVAVFRLVPSGRESAK